MEANTTRKYRHFKSVFTQITHFVVVADCIEEETAFPSKLNLLSENCHLKSVFAKA